MRILLFSGKGGVGKTSLAAATGLQLSKLGYRTLVMSVDPAHSLADAFDLETGLFDANTGDPLAINDNLSIQEVNIQKEIKRHWREISAYVVSVLRTTGISDVEAEELAILPGMEELSAMMYVSQFRREDRYQVIVLDCAPTAESLRFISMPTTLDWYMKHIFPFQRGLLKAVRPIANRVSPDARMVKLGALFAHRATSDANAIPLLAELLSIPAEPLSLTPAQRKVATINLLVDEIVRLGETDPVLLVLEDAHWIDPTTLELMTHLTDSIGQLRLLALVSARPDQLRLAGNSGASGTVTWMRTVRPATIGIAVMPQSARTS